MGIFYLLSMLHCFFVALSTCLLESFSLPGVFSFSKEGTDFSVFVLLPDQVIASPVKRIQMVCLLVAQTQPFKGKHINNILCLKKMTLLFQVKYNKNWS